MTTVTTGISCALVDPNAPGQVVTGLASLIDERPWAGSEGELRNAFVAVDWLVHRVLVSTVDRVLPERAADVRAIPPIVDSLPAFCAKELCGAVRRLEPQLAALIDEVEEAIVMAVWADAAVAAASARPHPLAHQVELYARSHAFSDPLDLGYLEKTGEAVGRAVRRALSLGVPVDQIAAQFRELATKLQTAR